MLSWVQAALQAAEGGRGMLCLQPALPLGPGKRGWGAAASQVSSGGCCWHSLGMDVWRSWLLSSSLGVWRPCGLIHTHFHTLQSKRGEKICPCFSLGSQLKIQPQIQPQMQPKVQPQIQRVTLSTPSTLPVADKP